jgi:putative holliday junction resolvase
MHGGILAIDWGKVRIGLAFTDPDRRVALPADALHLEPYDRFVLNLKVIVGDKDINLIVVGLPVRTDGLKGENEDNVMAFAQNLEMALKIKVVLYNEVFTSKIAEDRLHEAGKKVGKNKDSIAALVLLQDYLNAIKTE